MAVVPVVQKLDSANRRINHYQADRCIIKETNYITHWIDIFPVDSAIWGGGGGTWVNVCWVCAAVLSEPLPQL